MPERASMKPIRLTLRAELPDGRIADVIIPFSLPDGMTLEGREDHGSSDNTRTTRQEAPAETEPFPGSDRAQTEAVFP